jgi:hypothetical protein
VAVKRVGRLTTWLAVTLTVIDVGLALATLALSLGGSLPPGLDTPDLLAGVLFGAGPAVLAPIAGLIAVRRPRNGVGWLLGLAALSIGIQQSTQAYADYTLLNHSGDLPFVELALWIGNMSWPLLWAPFLLLLLLFPTGALPSSRWRMVAWAALLLPVMTSVFAATIPGPIHLSDTRMSAFDNPTGVDVGVPASELEQLFGPLFVAQLALLVPTVASLVMRFRRAGGVERQQIKWLMYTAALFLIAQVVTQVGLTGSWGQVVVNLAGDGIAAAIAIAVLRHRLFDIDLVINRTLVYGALSALLVVLYWISVVVLQQALRPLTAGSDLAIVGSTLAVAALFQPLRARIQQAVDHRFYRRRYDGAHTVEAFTTRLRDEVDLDSLSVELVNVVERTIQPARVSLWLRPSVTRRGGS